MKNRREIAMEKIVENRGNVSKSMREAGYSDAYASNPDQFTNTKGFKELADAYLPDDFLLRALAEDIEAKPKQRKQELELAFKVKGKMTEKIDHTSDGKPMNIVFDSSFANRYKEDEGA